MVKQNLVSFHIVERESNQQNLVTWTYPTVTNELATYIKTRCFPSHLAKEESFFYLKKNNQWIYINHFLYNEKLIALVVIAEELSPAKYKIFCDILSKKYVKTGSPVELVKLYIKLISVGYACFQENGSELGLNLKTFTKETGIKDLICDFGVEIILIYNAILLKRRILVYHHNVEKLQEKMLAMTNLVPNRNPNEYLLPWTENIAELKGHSFYLAGITEENAINNGRFYDIHVNLLNNEINISKGAKECFVMAKVHKDIAHFLVRLSESDNSETKVIEQIKSKTNDIIQQLYSVATVRDGKNLLTINDLKSRKFNAPLENFLFNLAVAENIMML